MAFWGPIILVFLLYITFLLWKVYINSMKDRNNPLPLPPGGVGLPVLGEMPAMAFEAAMGQDFYTKRRLAHGNIYKTHVMGKPVIRVIGPENIKAVLQAEGTKSEIYLPETVRSLMGKNALNVTNGYVHKLKRKISSKAFTKEALMGYTRALDAIIREEVSSWSQAEEGVRVFNMAERLATRASWEVLVGMRDFKQHENTVTPLFESMLRGFWSLPINLPGTTYYRAQQSNKVLTQLIEEQYKERLVSGHTEDTDYHDALSLILRSAEEQGHDLSSEEVVDSIREMLIAGHSTTASSMTSVVRRLAQNPRVVNKLREELRQEGMLDTDAPLTYERLCGLTYLGDVIYETLRLDPPAGGGFRKATRTLELGGYQIPKDWTIIWSIVDTHEVSDLFSDSRSSFQPERWQEIRQNGKDTAYNFATFGAGARACIGKEYAKVLLRVFTVNLVRMYDWELKNPDVQMQRLPVRQPKDKLPTVFRARGERHQSDRDCASLGCCDVIEDIHQHVDDVNMNVTKVSFNTQNHLRQKTE